MLGSQNLKKRTLDAANRVAFYGPCAPVAGVTGMFRARSFFPDFVRFARIPPVYEAGGSIGFGLAWDDEKENCRPSVNCLLTLYLVFAARLDTR